LSNFFDVLLSRKTDIPVFCNDIKNRIFALIRPDNVLQHGEAVCTSCMSNSKSVCMCVCSPFWCTAVGQFFSDLDHISPAYSPNGQDGIFAEVSRNASHQSGWLPRSKIVTYL